MSVIDILTRVDALCQKYEKYDLDRQRDAQISSTDGFLKLYTVLNADVETTLQKANEAATEKNRATVAALNAEVRRSKAALRNEIPKLEKLAPRKVKGLSREEMEARPDLVLALAEKIESIPEGTNLGNKRSSWGNSKSASNNKMEIKIDSVSPEDVMRPEQYEHSEESKGFRQEYETRKARQDQGLDTIAEGLSTLRNMAQDINEEMDRQVPLIDEIDSKVDYANAELRTTNVRLKDTVNKMRSSRNFCIDIILLCIVLGIAGYLYNVLKK
ncbi:syntaxin-71 [Selaginella moellendorffii]|uniref:syntaxin-71 n=1 Tax=Selaginella moellendorffii TaxID=88036 RepID=UPI000D1D0BF7|nr:syntaxin-71 [Selaginella moellendorffii]|eukprot:XP_024514955.1 syntaxin-71 [Selaginella moellendorffii]